MEIMGVNLPIPPEIEQQISQHTELSYDDFIKMQCDEMNAQSGNMTGYDCPECQNKGRVYAIRDGEIVGRLCRCIPIRESFRRLEESGLKHLMETQTFDAYKTDQPWQMHIKQTALQFLDDHNGKWLFAGGQVGSGKTHICTAIVGEFLRRGKSARYMLWRDEVVKLRACVNDGKEYSRLIVPLKTVDVLYIDDFFKTEQGTKPTPGDINVAFELINFRYADRKTTIISSEKTINEIMNIDEAIGSRIYERAKDYCLVIGKNQLRNYRMKEK